MIEIKNADVVKSGRRLFENITWRIASDEHWVISGPNGSGKTVLLELLAGIVHASGGEVMYDFISAMNWDERFAERKQKIHYIPAHAIQVFLQ